MMKGSAYKNQRRASKVVVTNDLQSGRPGWMTNVVATILARVHKARCVRDSPRLQKDPEACNGRPIREAFEPVKQLLCRHHND